MGGAKVLTKRRSIAVAALTALVVPLAACSSSPTSGGASSNAVLKVGVLEQFVDTNPFNLVNIIDYDMQELVYPELVQYGSQGQSQTVGDLASSWSHSPDGKTWTFHLVRGARWSDGKPLTSADVVFTFDTYLKYQGGAAAIDAPSVAGMRSVSAPNPTTVVFHYSAPVPPGVIFSFFAITPILPKHIWAKYATGNGAKLKTFPNKVPFVGGGAFDMTQWNGTNFLLLKRNPYYYGRKPAVAEVGIQYYTTPDGIINALKTHQIDYANTLPPTSAALLRRDGLVIDADPGVNDLGLYINVKAPLHRELLNLAVRQALNLAADRSAIISVAYPGSQPGASIVPIADGAWWNSSVKPTFNIAEANALLNRAGYKRGSNGIRIADGHPMAYQVIFDTGLGDAGDRLFQILQSDYKQIGVSITQDSMDSAAFNTKVFGPHDSYTGWDLALEQGAPSGDPSEALTGVQCAYLGVFNFAGFCNKKFEALNTAQLHTLNLPARRKLIDQAQAFVYSQLPVIYFLYEVNIDAHLANWTGFGAGPFGALSPESKVSFTGIREK